MSTNTIFKYFVKRKKNKNELRIVAINDSNGNADRKYLKNKITTSKYNVLTFLPLNLFEQFHRLVNLYFLLLIILEFIPEISSLDPITTLLPLILVLSVTAVKDGIDDWRRRKSDRKVNYREAKIIREQENVVEKWRNIKVGDVVFLKKDEAVPADMVILYTSESNGFSLIDTADLDGETNLKVKRAVETSSNNVDITHQKWEVHCEQPNSNLSKFEGVLYYSQVSTMLSDTSGVAKKPLTNDNILLRGCTLRATDWIYGLVIFAGMDTKLMKNSGVKRHKRTSFDVFLNKTVIGVFISMLICCLLCTFFHLAWERDVGTAFQIYQPWEDFFPKNNLTAFYALRGLMMFLSYFILLNTFVTVALYASVEMVRLAQTFFIMWDREMWHAESDTPADVKNMSLTEELGQIEYLFSDKTGTLTKNVMTFNKCSINGVKYGNVVDPVTGGELDPYENPDSFERLNLSSLMSRDADPDFAFYDRRLVDALLADSAASHRSHTVLRHYFRVMAMCNTVVPNRRLSVDSADVTYQAQSPDENALISAARSFGYVLRSRNPDSLTITEPGPGNSAENVVFPLLHVLGFDPIRKRMSVIVRDPTDHDKIIMYTKGADTALFPVAAADQDEIIEKTTSQLQEFAVKGLRTLAFGMRILSKDEFSAWKNICDEALSSIGDRNEKVRAAYNSIERNFVILGASAIEDKLQDGVPLAIRQLLAAGIRMWVLTGDKQETAINVGYSCNLLSRGTKLTVISDEDAAESGKVAEILKGMYFEMAGEHYVPPDEAKARKREMTFFQRLRNFAKSIFSKEILIKIGILPQPCNRYQTGNHQNFSLSLSGTALELILPPLKKKAKMPGAIPSTPVSPMTPGSLASLFGFAEVEANHLTHLFVQVATRCSTVICCRLTPLVKARIVQLFRNHLHVTTCSIGDGANDVPMIHSADIGVGVSGPEGLQAVLASDFSIAQFRYLTRLLLVHGRWNYTRMAVFALHFLYRNFTFTFAHVFYAFFCGGTAQTIYDPLYIAIYNSITPIPGVILGAMEQDVSPEGMLAFPGLYKVGLQSRLLNIKTLLLVFLDSLFSAICVFFVHYLTVCYQVEMADGAGWVTGAVELADLQTFSVTLGFTMLMLVTIRGIRITCYWTVWSHLGLVAALAIYAVPTFAYDPFFYYLVYDIHYPYEGAQYAALSWAPTWLAASAAICLALLPGIFLDFTKRCLKPSLTETVRDKETKERNKNCVEACLQYNPRTVMVNEASTLTLNETEDVALSSFSYSHAIPL